MKVDFKRKKIRVVRRLLFLGLIGLYSMIIYLMVGGKEKMKKKCPSAQLGSPDYIHECSRANVLIL